MSLELKETSLKGIQDEAYPNVSFNGALKRYNKLVAPWMKLEGKLCLVYHRLKVNQVYTGEKRQS